MIIKRSIRHHVNLSNYESVEIFGTIEVDTEELTLPTSNPDDVYAFVNEQLDKLVEEDLAAAIDNTDDDADFTSYVKTWKQVGGENG